MAYLTLRAARRLEQEVATFLAKEIKTHVNMSIHVDVSTVNGLIDGTDPTKLQERIELHRNLLDFRYNVRRRIQKANETGGVNEVIAKRKHALCERDFLTKLVIESERYFTDVENPVSWAYSPTAILNHITSLRDTRGKEALYGRTEHVEVPVITYQMFLSIKADVRVVNKNVQRFDEELLRINTQDVVEVFDQEVVLLAKAEIEV